MKRKGNSTDVNQMLLQLKSENDKLRQLKGEPGEVERLKYENKILKTELIRYQVQSQTDGF